MSPDCTRRAGSYWSRCLCGDCRQERARKRAYHYAGLPWRHPQEVAWAVLAEKIDAGWTSRAIGSATGLGPDYFDRHVAQRRKGGEVQLGPVAAAAVMNMGIPTEGQIGAEPARRRLRAMAANGYGLNTLTTETGLGFSTLAAIRSTKAERVGARVANVIAATYERLHMTPGADTQAIRIAREKGWPPPLAWIDIDDPNEEPDKGWRPVGNHSSVDLLAEWDHLRRAGVSIEQAAQQLGRSVNAIEKAIERARKNAA